MILKEPLWDYKSVYRFLKRTKVREITVFHKLAENKERIVFFGNKDSKKFEVYK